MSVGSIITLDSSRKVIRRQPVWPYPPEGEYPKRHGETSMYFIRLPYYIIPLYQQVPSSLSHLFPELP